MSGPHPIGHVWARWYDYGDLDSEPTGHVEGAALPARTTGVGVMETPVPEPIKLVDHALSWSSGRGYSRRWRSKARRTRTYTIPIREERDPNEVMTSKRRTENEANHEKCDGPPE